MIFSEYFDTSSIKLPANIYSAIISFITVSISSALGLLK